METDGHNVKMESSEIGLLFLTTKQTFSAKNKFASESVHIALKKVPHPLRVSFISLCFQIRKTVVRNGYEQVVSLCVSTSCFHSMIKYILCSTTRGALEGGKWRCLRASLSTLRASWRGGVFHG